METYNDSNSLYMTPVHDGSYIETSLIQPQTPLKKLVFDEDETEAYLETLDKNIKRLTLSGRDIRDISLISGFKNIVKLDISETKIRHVTYIPETVEILFCYNNFLTECPVLNERLKVLDLSSNFIEYMPKFTSNLEYVNLDGNKIKVFREFNHGLLFLSARNNSLTRLPFVPDTLKSLLLDNNPNLKTIPILPESLNICSIEFTNIYDQIYSFYCHDNKNFEVVSYNGFDHRKYNMEYIKNYSKMLHNNIIRSRSWFRRYVWSIREKVIKRKFSPNSLDIHMESFNSEDLKPGTIEWFDEMINTWNCDNDNHIATEINYKRTNEQMYNDLNNFYADSPYIYAVDDMATLLLGNFDNDYYEESEDEDYYHFNEYYFDDNYDDEHHF